MTDESTTTALKQTSAKDSVKTTSSGKPRQKTESMADRLDALVVGVIICSVSIYFLNQQPYIANFSWQTVPLMHEYAWSMPAIAIVVYLAFVHGVQSKKEESGAKETAFDRVLNWLLKYWNLFLTLLSLFMLLGLFIPLAQFNLRQITSGNWIDFICDTKMERWRGPMFFYLTIFTFSKYIELFDTAFLIIRRKPVSFLHWYHHCTVLAYTWFAILAQFSPGWYFSTINCAVHTIMYWYYYRRACGVFLSYDKFITTIQLVQMVLGVVATAVWTATYVLYGSQCPCLAPIPAIVAAVIMYGSYFYLFYLFYKQRYDKSAGKAKSKDI